MPPFSVTRTIGRVQLDLKVRHPQPEPSVPCNTTGSRPKSQLMEEAARRVSGLVPESPNHEGYRPVVSQQRPYDGAALILLRVWSLGRKQAGVLTIGQLATSNNCHDLTIHAAETTGV
ncbi:hypothetical protein B0T20DRAFT_474823 [Sordaria brevicollis]|uniref:Uncharacterized protein n=1 Tax=Sordaria brevicollis TaxID=83679 RepID=A0AAE0PN45_SORBR|nr:hypothetical protein B0T20DRAFT_474823 [Sordaria brevicollis]